MTSIAGAIKSTTRFPSYSRDKQITIHANNERKEGGEGELLKPFAFPPEKPRDWTNGSDVMNA